MRGSQSHGEAQRARGDARANVDTDERKVVLAPALYGVWSVGENFQTGRRRDPFSSSPVYGA